MTIVDIIIILIFVGGAIAGFRRAFLSASMELMVFLTSIFAAYNFIDPASQIISKWLPVSEGLVPFIAFIGVFLMVDLALGRLIRLYYSKIMIGFSKSRFTPQTTNIFEKVGVIAIHFARDFMFVALAVNLMLFLPIMPQLRTALKDAKLTEFFVVTDPGLEKAFAKIIEPAVHELQALVTTKTITDESIPIDTPVGDLMPDSSAGREMLDLVNKERIANGLKALEWRDDLAKVGEDYARYMWINQYFGHIDPEGNDPFDRLESAGIRFLVAGENLAMAPSTPIAHQGLMDSPGHRANILQPDFGHMGIGVIRNGLYGAIYVQLFTE